MRAHCPARAVKGRVGPFAAQRRAKESSDSITYVTYVTYVRHEECIVDGHKSTVSQLSSKAENALNETRMLILGAQVLIGFDFHSAFQPGFDRLPRPAQELRLVGLGLMVIAVGLLIAPGAFHRIVERGNDSPRLIDFTGRIASFALLPFALGIGLDVYVVGLVVLNPTAAVALGIVGTLFAFVFWYGLDWLWRAYAAAHATSGTQQRMQEPTPLETRIKQVLTEARVVLPGAQALLGFQLAAVLTDAFNKLPQSSQYVHLACLMLMAASIVFLMAPAAFHRIVEHGEDTERLHRFSSAMVLAALVPLALGIAGDFYVVANKVLNAQGTAMALAGACLLFFFALWFGVTLAVRARSDGTRAASLKVSRAAR